MQLSLNSQSCLIMWHEWTIAFISIFSLCAWFNFKRLYQLVMINCWHAIFCYERTDKKLCNLSSRKCMQVGYMQFINLPSEQSKNMLVCTLTFMWSHVPLTNNGWSTYIWRMRTYCPKDWWTMQNWLWHLSILHYCSRPKTFYRIYKHEYKFPVKNYQQFPFKTH